MVVAKVEKIKFHASLISLCVLGVFFFNSMYFLLIAFFLCCTKILKSFEALIVFFILSPSLLLVDFFNFKDYLIMFLTVIGLSIFYKGKEDKFVLVYSYFIMFFLFFIIIKGDYVINVKDILIFRERLFFDWNGEQINSNILGLLASIVAIGFYINKKYFLMFFPLFILLLTQSRSAIIFYFIFLIFSSNLSLKSFFTIFLCILICVLILYFTPVGERFLSGPGESGEERLVRILLHEKTINNSFPFGFPYQEYLNLSKIYGSIDNNYIYLYIRYGIVGVFSLIALMFFYFKNSKDKFDNYRRGIFIAILVQGILESSMYGNYFIWPLLALCFNSFNFSRFIK